MTNQFNQALIEEGKVWAEAELHAMAVDRGVKFHEVVWTESPQAQVWIVEIKSGAGEHTLSLPYTTLEQCANDENAQTALRGRLRGLVGDLARIERRGHLR
jgi:hypothetical protein